MKCNHRERERERERERREREREAKDCLSSWTCGVAEWLQFMDVAGLKANALWGSHGARAAAGLSALLADSSCDPHTGFLESETLGSFVVRARSPWKGSLKPHKLRGLAQWKSLARSLGLLTAAAHSRADNDYDAFLVPSSFEHAFAARVPHDLKHEWMKDVKNYTWQQWQRRKEEFECWLQHRAKSSSRSAQVELLEQLAKQGEELAKRRPKI
jgi:hypothetical protein